MSSNKKTKKHLSSVYNLNNSNDVGYKLPLSSLYPVAIFIEFGSSVVKKEEFVIPVGL